MTAILETTASDVDGIAASRVRRGRHRRIVIGVLAVLVLAGFAASLMFGKTFYPPADVLRVTRLNQTIPIFEDLEAARRSFL